MLRRPSFLACAGLLWLVLVCVGFIPPAKRATEPDIVARLFSQSGFFCAELTAACLVWPQGTRSPHASAEDPFTVSTFTKKEPKPSQQRFCTMAATVLDSLWKAVSSRYSSSTSPSVVFGRTAYQSPIFPHIPLNEHALIVNWTTSPCEIWSKPFGDRFRLCRPDSEKLGFARSRLSVNNARDYRRRRYPDLAFPLVASRGKPDLRTDQRQQLQATLQKSLFTSASSFMV